MNYVFNITPRPYLRRNRSDDWLLMQKDWKLAEKHLKRKAQLQAYYEYMDNLRAQARELGFMLPDVLTVFFLVPMPKSWSDKKRAEMRHKAHQQTPDISNYIKAFEDAITYRPGLTKQSDAHVYAYDMVVKVWADEGEIIIIDQADAQDRIQSQIQEVLKN